MQCFLPQCFYTTLSSPCARYVVFNHASLNQPANNGTA